jgi:hypothetical protein
VRRHPTGVSTVVIGSGATTLSSLVVLDGSTQLSVVGTGALGKAEALAASILPKLT